MHIVELTTYYVNDILNIKPPSPEIYEYTYYIASLEPGIHRLIAYRASGITTSLVISAIHFLTSRPSTTIAVSTSLSTAFAYKHFLLSIQTVLSFMGYDRTDLYMNTRTMTIRNLKNDSEIRIYEPSTVREKIRGTRPDIVLFDSAFYANTNSNAILELLPALNMDAIVLFAGSLGARYVSQIEEIDVDTELIVDILTFPHGKMQICNNLINNLDAQSYSAEYMCNRGFIKHERPKYRRF